MPYANYTSPGTSPSRHVHSRFWLVERYTMGKTGYWREWVLLGLILHFHFFISVSSQKTPVRKFQGSRTSNLSLGVRNQGTGPEQVVVDNGLVQISFSVPDGHVICIQYNGIDNLLEILNDDDNRGYWDAVWNWPGEPIKQDRLRGTEFKVITQNEEQIELSFSRVWDVSVNGTTVAPMNVDKRYIMRRDCQGFYAYAIFDHPEGFHDIDMDQVRIVYKLQKEKFHYMAMSDDRQRLMPMPEDRLTGIPLAFPEAVLLTNPTNPEIRGEVDDKYQYSCENQDNIVHGWICTDPPVGFWMITPSNEFRTAGPIKQDLTSHVGPTVLSMFVSTHYAGKEVGMKFRNGEPWRKVFGPVFVYVNSVSPDEDLGILWQDAKEQMYAEVASWPYNFIESQDFATSEERGSISGQLLVYDRYISNRYIWGDSAYVGMAAPGEVGSWQRENKGYQFWTRANEKGHFRIENIRAGEYNLYAWVPGIIGDYKYDANISITPGCSIKLDPLVFEPPRTGPTLWEIGIPDRTAAEFYVPDPYPTLMNNLYTFTTQNKFRQYGLWDRYADLYSQNDLIYTVGVSDHRKHWFFAQVTRNVYNQTYEPTTWQIVFELEDVNPTGSYNLQLALASVTESDLQVRFNDESADPPHFSTGLIGMDNAIARHGIHGLYWLFSIPVPSFQLHDGKNTIFLTQTEARGPFQGVMYDYIRLEGPPDI